MNDHRVEMIGRIDFRCTTCQTILAMLAILTVLVGIAMLGLLS